MIVFFCFEKTLKVYQNEFGFSYEHKFEKVPSTDKGTQLPFENIYFSTPSDFHNHMENIKNQIGENAGKVNVLEPPQVVNHPQFPKHIGFLESWDKVLETVKEASPGNGPVKLAILNAMSNAIGDHLIGMQAFDYYQEKLRKDLGREIDISFYQLNPYRVAPITKQWHGKFQHIYMLPNRLARLVENDVFVDLGTLLLRDNFDNQHMIDFFFEALSLDSAQVPSEAKRTKYKILPEVDAELNKAFNILKGKGRPILLFHRTSTSPIRMMSEMRARNMIAEIIKKTDYFVISADRLEYQNKRFMDFSRYSSDVEHFAGIISKVDGVVTVDTATYHIADAFDVPTVVLFTTINPDYRIKYYPFTQPVMLEDEEGRLYGRHKADKDENKAKEEIEYVDKKWGELSVDTILGALETAKTRKEV